MFIIFIYSISPVARNISVHIQPHVFRLLIARLSLKFLSRTRSVIIHKSSFIPRGHRGLTTAVVANSFSMLARNRFVRYRSFFSLVSSHSLPFFSFERERERERGGDERRIRVRQFVQILQISLWNYCARKNFRFNDGPSNVFPLRYFVDFNCGH